VNGEYPIGFASSLFKILFHSFIFANLHPVVNGAMEIARQVSMALFHPPLVVLVAVLLYPKTFDPL